MVPLMALLCFALVMMGTLFWVDNTWALITDDDPAIMIDLSQLWREMVNRDYDIKSGLRLDNSFHFFSVTMPNLMN